MLCTHPTLLRSPHILSHNFTQLFTSDINMKDLLTSGISQIESNMFRLCAEQRSENHCSKLAPDQPQFSSLMHPSLLPFSKEHDSRTCS